MTIEYHNNPDEVGFQVNGFTIRGWAWGDKGHPVVLALHGWLDNCASFIELSRHLPGIRLIALDSAGQGCSDHRSLNSAYNIWQDVGEVIQIADQLGLNEMSLIGHSRGAVIAMLIAGSFPDRVKNLILIDGLIPYLSEEADAPAQLAKAVTDNLAMQSRIRRCYNSLRLLSAGRRQGEIPLSERAALQIAQRGHRVDESGYHWSFDQRLRGASELKLTGNQVKAFLSAIRANTHLFLASDGLAQAGSKIAAFAREFEQINVHNVSGGHHLHMDEQAPELARMISSCLPCGTKH